MATFTVLDEAQGQQIAATHGLGKCHAVIPIAAGTVNSNYFLETDAGRVFVRVYEQQDVEGVTYEWALLAHLAAKGVALPPLIEGPGPGELRIAGKPIAVFRAISGHDLCQAQVTRARARKVGTQLARAAHAGSSFGIIREGRFELADVRDLLERAKQSGRSELTGVLARLRALADELDEQLPTMLPRGVVHGDLFRDNVLWENDEVVALLDWESASDGILIYDVAVTLLAWCCGDRFDFGLARALVEGYVAERALSAPEQRALWWHMRMACLRFATTRITDVYLRGSSDPGYKDYRRFLMRLDALEAETPESLCDKLGLGA